MKLFVVVRRKLSILRFEMKMRLYRFLRNEVTPFLLEHERKKGKGFHYKGREFVHHSTLHFKHMAFHRFTLTQKLIIAFLIYDLILALIIDWHLTVTVLIGILIFIYFADLLFNLFLIIRSFENSTEIKISDQEVHDLNRNEWPTYTILCPLYREWKVLSQFITSMSMLDYPKDKLQVILLLEEDDTETAKKIKEFVMPHYFKILVVPHSLPKTKPKACNYGLQHATGKYVVIYDAEDVPDPLQLKKAVLAFERGDEMTICIQAKLDFYNPYQNILTRVFTAEYSLLFNILLVGLQSIQGPIPLGGTSNHFRTFDLHQLKGWDSFNVTEDADLGIRLAKQGYKTAIIDSITLEEANSKLRNWFNQRSRWIKGYMQTYLVHTRSDYAFTSHKKLSNFTIFQFVIGAKVLSMFINPLLWIITICYFLFRAHIGDFIDSFFPGPVLYMGVLSLILGNFLHMYYAMIGSKKRGHHELVKYGIFMPIYWLAMSAAAWLALYQLMRKPHYWSKTKHGLHLDKPTAYKSHHIIMNTFSKQFRQA